MSNSPDSFIRMIWDFYGPQGYGTAQHFLRHLSEFLKEREIPSTAIEVEEVSPTHAATFVDLDHAHLDEVGRALQPHRVYEVSDEPDDA